MRRLYGQGQDLGTPDVGFAKSSRTLPPLKRARVASGDRPEPTEAAAETTKLFARLWVLLGESVCHVSSGLSQGPWGKPVPTCSHQFPGPPRRTLSGQPKSVPTFGLAGEWEQWEHPGQRGRGSRASAGPGPPAREKSGASSFPIHRKTGCSLEDACTKQQNNKALSFRAYIFSIAQAQEPVNGFFCRRSVRSEEFFVFPRPTGGGTQIIISVVWTIPGTASFLRPGAEYAILTNRKSNKIRGACPCFPAHWRGTAPLE